VISAFFFHWVARSRETGTVADRAAKRVAARERRAVRRPRDPVPGIDQDVGDDTVSADLRAAVGMTPSMPAELEPEPPSAAGVTPGEPAHPPVALPKTTATPTPTSAPES
jgi:hypothetical protein